MEDRKKLIFAGQGVLFFCLFCTASLPIVLFSSSGYDENYISYWAAHSLSEFGELLNHNGERVEVSSSLLHVVLLALAHKLTFLSFSLLGGVLGIAFAVLTVLKTYRLGNVLSPAVGRVAALLLALNPLFLYWAVSGTESTLMSWLVICSVFSLVQLTRLGFSIQALFWTLLPLTGVQLVRPEGSVFVLTTLIVCWAFVWYQHRDHGPEKVALSRKSMAWILMLSILIAGLILGWRFSYFGQPFPLSVIGKMSGSSFAGDALLTEYRYFIEAIAFRSGYTLYLLIFAGVSIWGLLKIVRFPHLQPPVLWLSALFCWLYLCFIFIAGGNWVVGQNGEWILSARFFSHVAPLMALMIAIAVCALKDRWKQYVCGAVLGLSLLIPAVRLVGSESMGVPVHIGIGYADQIRRHSVAKDMSWFDITNRIHMRDITLIADLNRTIATLKSSLDRPVRLMSRQLGMVMHHVARTNYGDILVNDRRGLNDTALLNCEPSQTLKHRTIGLNLNYRYFFENWNAYSRCVERPDIIYDILINPDEMRALIENDYTVIYEQNGYQGYGENRVQQHAFYAVSNELVPMLDAKNVNLNAQYWQEENVRLYDPEYNTRFVVIGHGRGLLEGHTDVLEEIVDIINRQEPQYVFVLGDFVRLSSDEEWDQLEKHMFKRLDAPVVFVPGNHEMRSNAVGDDSVYRRRMQPFPDVITTRYVNFLFLNSSLRLPEIKQKLEEAFAKCDEDKPTILVTHHNVWTFGPPINRHVPTFSSQQFLPLIDGKVDAIISGDGSARFKEESLPIGVHAYQTGIGMKGRYDPLFFAIGNIGVDGELDFYPFEVSINPYHAWYSVAEPKPTLPYLLKNAPPIGAD